MVKKMPRRHTIILADDLEERLRKIQAELINISLRSISFSEIINQLVRDGLEKRKASKSKLQAKFR